MGFHLSKVGVPRFSSNSIELAEAADRLLWISSKWNLCSAETASEKYGNQRLDTHR